MKKLFTFLSVSLITLLLVSCGGGKDYRNMIPSDAFMVMSAKPKTIAHKAQVGDFTQNDLYKLLEEKLAEQDEPTPEVREYILSLIAEPSKSGLSMDHDVFLFMRGENIQHGDANVGLLFKVNDRKAVDKFAEFMVEEAELERFEEEGLTILANKNDWSTQAVIYNNDALLVFINSKGFDASLPVIKQLFAQKKEESIMNRPQIASVLDGNNDMNMILSYGSLMPMLKQMGIPLSLEWMGKMSVVMPVNFEKGAVVSDAKIFFDDEEAEKQYMEFAALSPKSTGEFVKYLPEGSIAAFGGGLNGAKSYELLTQIPMYSVALSMVPQAQTIMNAIEGDILISFNTMSSDGRYPLATIIAKVNDNNIANTIRDLAATTGFRLNETAPGHFSGEIMGVQIWLGCKDDMLYISSDNGFIELLSNGEGASMDDRFGHIFKDNYGGFLIDFVSLRDMLESMITNNTIDPQVGMALPFIAIFDNMQMSAHNLTEVKMVTNMTDKDKNSAEVLFNTLETAVKMFVGHAHDGFCH